MADRERSPIDGDESPMETFVDEVVAGRGGCLVVESDSAVPIAIPRGIEFISFRAVADERLLAYAGMAELCAPLLPLLDGLPPVQAHALQGALALGPPGGDALAVAVGFRSLLHLAAERAPLLVVVEQAHLLDQGTAAALAYTARRLRDVAVGIVVSQDPDAPFRLELPGAKRAVSSAGQPGPTPTTEKVDIEGALERARRRGSAADVAVALDALAAASTGNARTEALLRSGQAWLDAGQAERALGEGLEAYGSTTDGGLAARSQLLLGRAEAVRGNGPTSARHLRAAAELAELTAPEVAVEALLLVASPALFAGRIADAAEALAAARVHLDATQGPQAARLGKLLVAAETALALATGRPTDVGPIAAMVDELAADPTMAADLSLIVTSVALPLVWLGRYDAAASLLHGVIAALRARGAIGPLPMPLCALAVAERRAGRPVRSLIHAAEARELAKQAGDRGAVLFACTELANAHSLFGDIDRCRASAQVVLASGTRGAFRTSALSALATAELWSGDPAVVVDLLEPLSTAGEALAQSVTLFHHTLITAYVAVGRTADARRLLAEMAAAAPPDDARLRAVVLRCEALLAPADERDARFAEAIKQADDQPVNRGLTRLLHARRLLADGCVAEAATLLHELSQEVDENLLGVARGARLTLTRLGLVAVNCDPAWSQLDPAELDVALAAADQTPLMTLADRLRLSPPEIERLRDSVLVLVGARSGPEVAQAMRRPVADADELVPASSVEVRLLGGLTMLVDGSPIALPAGAASVTVALLALRRAVHVDELTDVLWPEASPDVARRRLRNVLARVKQAAGPVLLRHGERVELAAEVVVDHHVLDARARRALAAPLGPERRASVEAVLDAYSHPLLPERLYEEWAEPARRRTEIRCEELLRALTEESAAD